MTRRAEQVGALIKEAMIEMELPSELYFTTFEPQNAGGHCIVKLHPEYEFRITYDTALDRTKNAVREQLTKIFGKYKTPQDAARAHGYHNMTDCWCDHVDDDHTGPLGEEGFRHRHCYRCAEKADGRTCCELPKEQRPKDLEQ